MKKIIIAASIILASGVTALSLTRKEEKQAASKVKIETAEFTTKPVNAPKSDLGSAD